MLVLAHAHRTPYVKPFELRASRHSLSSHTRKRLKFHEKFHFHRLLPKTERTNHEHDKHCREFSFFVFCCLYLEAILIARIVIVVETLLEHLMFDSVFIRISQKIISRFGEKNIWFRCSSPSDKTMVMMMIVTAHSGDERVRGSNGKRSNNFQNFLINYKL